MYPIRIDVINVHLAAPDSFTSVKYFHICRNEVVTLGALEHKRSWVLSVLHLVSVLVHPKYIPKVNSGDSVDCNFIACSTTGLQLDAAFLTSSTSLPLPLLTFLHRPQIKSCLDGVKVQRELLILI